MERRWVPPTATALEASQDRYRELRPLQKPLSRSHRTKPHTELHDHLAVPLQAWSHFSLDGFVRDFCLGNP